MRTPLRALAFAPLCGLATLAAAPPVAAPTPVPVVPLRAAAPATPPNGTYVYELSRNGGVQGATTIALLRRDERAAIETNEAGRFGAASARIVASFAYGDLHAIDYVATYRAPFPRRAPLGRVDATRRPVVAVDASVTVRYATDAHGAHATVDGLPGGYVSPAPAPSGPTPAIVDAPFMTAVLLLPTYRMRTNANDVAFYSLAFPSTPNDDAAIVSAPMRRIATPARDPRTPKSALALAIRGLGTIWYDPANGIVYAAHFDALNVDAHLTSFVREARTAAIDDAPQTQTTARPAGRAITLDDGEAKVAGVIDLPGTPAAGAGVLPPVVVLVPPGPGGDRNFDADDPQPMYLDLATALAAKGYASLRYDPRGTGKTRVAAPSQTWDTARADAEAAIRFAQADGAFDPKRVFVAGYGSGADLAIAASFSGETSESVAGVIALGPTTLRYRACAQRLGANLAHPDAWQRSAFARDPAALALRATLPLFVLHPGVGTCGETASDVAAYDDALRAANPNATIVVASDLSQRFGGRYDADSTADTAAFFPYRFDPSTLDAIGEWLDAPHTAARAPRATLPSGVPSGGAHPPPPPPLEHGTPRPRTSATPSEVMPGQIVVPSPLPAGTAPPT